MRKNTPTWGRESPKRITVKRKPRGFRVVARDGGYPGRAIIVYAAVDRKGKCGGLVIDFYSFG